MIRLIAAVLLVGYLSQLGACSSNAGVAFGCRTVDSQVECRAGLAQ